jgi:hypothetical protein
MWKGTCGLGQNSAEILIIKTEQRFSQLSIRWAVRMPYGKRIMYPALPKKKT